MGLYEYEVGLSFTYIFFLYVAMLLVCGGLVNGPYALITTAVSADLVRPEVLETQPSA